MFSPPCNSSSDEASASFTRFPPKVAVIFLGLPVRFTLTTVVFSLTIPSNPPSVAAMAITALSPSSFCDIRVVAPLPDLYSSVTPSSSYSVNSVFPYGYTSYMRCVRSIWPTLLLGLHNGIIAPLFTKKGNFHNGAS